LYNNGKKQEDAGVITSYSRELMLGIPQGTLIDIETTGLDMGQDEIVLFGYIKGSHL
jgi:uncharacterized protein YprB with RNaseH-like and TPR domain